MFRIEDLQTPAELEAMEAAVRRACDAAVHDPFAQFLFIDRYTRWNGYAGALVAKLSGNIGESQDLFLDPNEPDRAQAVRYAYRRGIARPPGPATPASGPGPGPSYDPGPGPAP